MKWQPARAANLEPLVVTPSKQTGRGQCTSHFSQTPQAENTGVLRENGAAVGAVRSGQLPPTPQARKAHSSRSNGQALRARRAQTQDPELRRPAIHRGCSMRGLFADVRPPHSQLLSHMGVARHPEPRWTNDGWAAMPPI